ncbi:hypothetical protein SUGI_0038220 [Cryptomeria japonica]|nr:hypothetical protein SUGI_0038220 [Cryptomeria japonica]
MTTEIPWRVVYWKQSVTSAHWRWQWNLIVVKSLSQIQAFQSFQAFLEHESETFSLNDNKVCEDPEHTLIRAKCSTIAMQPLTH